MIKNLMSISLLMLMSLSQAQDNPPSRQESLCPYDLLDDQKALSDYLSHISKIQGINAHGLNNIEKILNDFLDYKKSDGEDTKTGEDSKGKAQGVMIDDFDIDLDKKKLSVTMDIKEASKITFRIVKNPNDNRSQACKVKSSLEKKVGTFEYSLDDCDIDFSSGSYLLSSFLNQDTSSIYNVSKDFRKDWRKSKMWQGLEKEQAESEAKEKRESEGYQKKLERYFELSGSVASASKALEEAERDMNDSVSQVNKFSNSQEYRDKYDKARNSYNEAERSYRSASSQLIDIEEKKRSLEVNLHRDSYDIEHERKKHRKESKEIQEKIKILEAYEDAAARMGQTSGRGGAERNEITEKDGAVVFKAIEKPSGESERVRLRGQHIPTDFAPTGLYLPPGTELKLNVELQKGEHLPTLLIGTYGRRGYYCSLWGKDGCQKEKMDPRNFAREKALKEGENIVSDPDGGLLYVRYVNDQPSNSVARISFLEGMKPAPFFRLGKTTHKDWLKTLEDDKYKGAPDVVLEGERAIIVVSRENAIKYKDEDQEEALRAVDNIIRLQDEFSGLDGSSDKHMPLAHKYLMTQMKMYEGTSLLGQIFVHYMGYNEHISIPSITTKKGSVVDGHTLWHEIGHAHQQKEWTWNEVSEIGANFYAWVTAIKMGHPDNYDSETYQRMIEYLKLPDKQRDFKNIKGSQYDPEDVRLSFFKQLYKAYGEGFYKKLHKYVREHPENLLRTSEEKMRYFMLAACQASDNDLGDFFKRWGFHFSDSVNTGSVYAEISRLGLPFPDDEIRRKLYPSETLYDHLKGSIVIKTSEEGIDMKLDTDWIKGEAAQLRFIIKELDIDNFHIGTCEFEEIIEGGRGSREFFYPFKEKCTGYDRVDRGEGRIDRKIRVEALIDGQTPPFHKTDFEILRPSSVSS